MSGHSHWASIKHKKQATDAKKGKAFSKVSKLLMAAAKDGGPDPATNIKLQFAIDQAREVNMPKDNVERAIKKGAGGGEGVQLESTFYEGFGPAGVAIMLEAITDNRNRTVSEIRKIFETRNGRLGEVNSVRYLFERKGLFTVSASAYKEDEILNAALESGAGDAELAGDVFEITCDPKDFIAVKKKLTDKGIKLKSAELTYVAKDYIPINDKEEARKILDMMDALEDHEDVQTVYTNFDIPEEVVRILKP